MYLIYYHIIISFFLLLSNCSLFEEDPEPLEAITTYFTADINGETFSANSLDGGIELWRGYNFLEFSGQYSSKDIIPYREEIVFSMVYEEETTWYSLHNDSLLTDLMGFKVPSSSYYEAESDVTLSYFKLSNNSDGFITVKLEEREDGRTTISGTFEMTVYLDYRIESNFPQTEDDTLYISNGQYLLLLDDRREK